MSGKITQIVFMLVLLLSGIATVIQAEHKHGIHCSTPDPTQEEKQALRAMKVLMKRNAVTQDLYQLPIIFHVVEPVWDPTVDEAQVVGDNEEEARELMYCRVKDAIRLLNEEFSGTRNGYSNTIDPTFQSIQENLNVEFLPAAIDPDGNVLPEPGMNWQPEAVMGDFSKTDSEWDKIRNEIEWTGRTDRHYVEVYLVAGKGGAWGSGYTIFPWSSKPAAVIFNYRWLSHQCGSEGKPTSRNTDFASILTHEIGHYFGLNHTFSGGCGNEDCTEDGDDICDTPPSEGDYDAEGAAPGVCHNISDCGGEVNAENFMDYACYKMFTKGQVEEMEYWLTGNGNQTYPRDNLWKASNLAATVNMRPPSVMRPPVVSITSPEDNARYEAGQTITMSADASDSDGDIVSVEFFVNGSSIKIERVIPYEFTWEVPDDGEYDIIAVATDNDNQQTTSDQISINAGSVVSTDKIPGYDGTISAGISPKTGKGIYHLEFNGPEEAEYEIHIHSAGGQLILSRDLQPGSHVLNISGRPQGVYIMSFPGTGLAPVPVTLIIN